METETDFNRREFVAAAATHVETAILAGGCFWGMQDLIRKLPGVKATRVGYSGGDVPNATYRNHATHAEAIEVVFDPTKLSYRELLELFFQIHDPTTKNRQGNDVGSSYRSAIYYLSDEQKRVAQETIADVDASGLWPGRVMTEVTHGGAVLGSRARAPGLLAAIIPAGTRATFRARTGDCRGARARARRERHEHTEGRLVERLALEPSRRARAQRQRRAAAARREERRTMARGANGGPVRRRAAQRNRAAVQLRALLAVPAGPLSLHLLRHAAVRLDQQVRKPYGLAELHVAAHA